MEYIGKEEEEKNEEDVYHSFSPEDWPENVNHAPLTSEEQSAVDGAYLSEEQVRRMPSTRRYLPCHYFDHVCGSSTGGWVFTSASSD